VIAGSDLLSLLLTLIVVGLICWLLWWFIGYAGPPEPFNKVARVIIALVAIVFLINVLMGLGGHPLIVWR
jgi:hypothetical protein